MKVTGQVPEKVSEEEMEVLRSLKPGDRHTFSWKPNKVFVLTKINEDNQMIFDVWEDNRGTEPSNVA